MRFEERVAKLRIEKHIGRETSEFLNDVVKMAQGEAFEYLMGEVNFCGAKVDLSLRPMIPRPETEFWVGQAIEQIAISNKQTVVRVLDIFSGSGNVGLAVLKNIPESQVDFIEYNTKLKEQIEISIEKNKFEKSRTNVLIGDVFDLHRPCLCKYNYIFAVPPYVPPQMREEVMKELGAEDPLCFFDKEDGFFYIKKVLKEVRNYLNKGGTLFIEFDITYREKIEELVKENNFQNYCFLKDPYGHECCMALKILDK